MKRLLSLLPLLASVSLASATDGWVQFANTPLTKVMTNSVYGGPATGPISGPVGSYYFALFIAPTSILTCTGPDDPNWTFTGYYATNMLTFSSGRLAGPPGPDAQYDVQIAGYAPGTQANFLVRGWSADFGHDWSQVRQELDWGAYGSYYAQSLIGTDIYLADAGGPYYDVFGATYGIPGFTLNYMVPEPSSLALAGLGAVVLLFRRHR